MSDGEGNPAYDADKDYENSEAVIAALKQQVGGIEDRLGAPPEEYPPPPPPPDDNRQSMDFDDDFDDDASVPPISEDYVNVADYKNGIQKESPDGAAATTIAAEGLEATEALKERERETLFFGENGKQCRIDYILAYEDEEDEKDREKNGAIRDTFESNLQEEGLIIEFAYKQDSVDGKSNFVKISASWDALATGAELLGMRKRLKMDEDTKKELEGCCTCDPCTVGEPVIEEEEDYFTAAFSKDHIHWFEIEDEETFFTNSERSLIVKEVLDRTSFTPAESEEQRFGIHKLISESIYKAAYPIHEGPHKPFADDDSPWEGRDKDRMRLYESWARPGRFLRHQPLDLIRKYFGEKVGIYFTWLGFYTAMLIPASIVGIAAFVYGCVTLFEDEPGNDICDKNTIGNTTMCPSCDVRCDYWKLHSSCLYSRLTYLFDNYATLVFAGFMAVWATVFLEFWKRKEKEIGYEWDVNNFELEERPRPEFEFKIKKKKMNPITKIQEPYIPWYSQFPRSCTSCTIVLFFIILVCAAILGVIIYRMIISVVFYQIPIAWMRQWTSIITSITAACINLVIIMILNIIYKWVAKGLTDIEGHRTETEYEDAFTFKMFLFQFINFYGSLFYIAYFKGSFVGRPGSKENYLFDRFRPEACDPAGCLIELSIQLAIIMVGKQALNNAKELLIPAIVGWCRKSKNKKNETETNLYMRWEKDLDMPTPPPLGLFEEYLEMVIQYGFVTLFVAAFPLAPFFALINNIIEIRLDAYKFVVIWRRTPAFKAQDIGVWMGILQSLSFMAVLTNAFIIGWTSEFIPKMYYIFQGPNQNLTGYVDWSLSTFSTADYANGTAPEDPGILGPQEVCSFKAFREPYDAPNAYDYTLEFWHIMTARLAFIIIFEHVVYFIGFLVASIIPDTPASVKQMQLYERQLVKKQHFDATFQNVIRNSTKKTRRRDDPLREAADAMLKNY